MTQAVRFSSMSFNLKKIADPVNEDNFQSVTFCTKQEPRHIPVTVTANGREATGSPWQLDTLGDVYLNTRLVGTSPKLKAALETGTVPEHDREELQAFLLEVLEDLQYLPERESRPLFPGEPGERVDSLTTFKQRFARPIEEYIVRHLPYAERRVNDSISVFFNERLEPVMNELPLLQTGRAHGVLA